MSDADWWADAPDHAVQTVNDERAGGGSTEAVKPPRSILVVGVVVVIASLVLMLTRSNVGHIIGWFLGSVVTVGLVAWYTAADARRRQSGFYSPNRLLDVVRSGIAAVGVLLAGVHVWYFANSVAS